MCSRGDRDGKIKLSAVLPMESGTAEILRTASFAEELGLHGLWVYENFFFGGAFSTLGAIAATTQRIRLGVGTVSPFGRNPAVLAMEAAQLHQLTGGRFALGLGTGPLHLVDQMGVTPARPLATMRESVHILKTLFVTEIDEYQGTRFNMRNVKLGVDIEGGGPPVYIGAIGDKMMSLTGEVADGLVFSTKTPLSFMRRAMQKIATSASSSNRSMDEFHTVAYVPYSMSSDATEARDRLKPYLATSVARMAGKPSSSKLVTDDGILDQEEIASVAKGMQEGKRPEQLIRDEVVDALCIAGTPDRCAERLHDYHQAGVQEIALFGFGADRSGLKMLQETMALVSNP